MEETPAVGFQIHISVDDGKVGTLFQKQHVGQPVIHLVVANCHHVRRQQVHNFYGGNAFVFLINEGTLEHIPRNGIDHILFFPSHFIDVAGQHGDAAHQFIVYLFYQEITMQIVRMKQGQFL